MNNHDKLIKYFETFPGVGARQARRFAFHVLTLPPADTKEISHLVSSIQDDIVECKSCRRYFAAQGTETLCNICSDGSRDFSKLTDVERDSDIQTIERAGAYEGLYFVLGGTVPLLESKESNKLRGSMLKTLVETRLEKDDLEEVILAFSVNPDGENTGRFVESLLKDISTDSLKISYLGRGLSTGSELEYADPETIKNALKNRY